MTELSLWLPSSYRREDDPGEQRRATTTTVTKALSDSERRRQAPRSWGSVRPTRNGRWQARFPDPAKAGALSACGTFATRDEAEAALEAKRVEVKSRMQAAPPAESFGAYASRWLQLKTDLRPLTRALYAQELRDHILPTFAMAPMTEIGPEAVRAWHADLHERHAVTAAKCYRLLRTIFNTAVNDEVVGRNPCRIKGGGQERSPERPTATAVEIRKLVGAAPDHYKIVVLAASWLTMRRGEILGLQRGDIDLVAGTVSIKRAVVNVNGKPIVGEPKSAAGTRTVAIPAAILADFAEHLERYVGEEAHAWVAVGEKGDRLSIEMVHRLWARTRQAAGLEHLRLHDLRHSGAVLIASTGAPLRQIMARLGHSSERAAMRYQHAVAEQDRAIADGLSALAAG